MLPDYIKDNMNIPITDIELDYMNLIAVPYSYPGYEDFRGSREESILFYTDYNDIFPLMSGIDEETLRTYMKSSGVEVEGLNLQELLNIQLARMYAELPMYLEPRNISFYYENDR